MDNKNYDIASAFERIEKELIESMMRNLDRHRAEEDELGINWSQWQTVQLQALEEYKKRNAKKYKTEFKNINSTIDNLIKIYRKEGNTKQEQEILQAIRSGLPYKRQSDAIVGEFIKLNDRKIEALIKATTNDFEKAEIAMLRRANDQYRKIIYSAQVYAATGGTYAKAVDMAAKDFLQAGINCVEYKNGSRHTMKDYADMAIRTAQKRAYLTGEGEKRKEWGEPLVIMNKRGNPCPKCFPWVGLILIDDVWSGGTPDDGPYKLMSTAISEGLYHPRCKDSHSTYFPGITTVDDKTVEDSKRLKEDYEKEQKINYYKRQKEKCERIAESSLDEDNKRMYQARAEEWGNKIIDESKDVLENMSNSSIIKSLDVDDFEILVYGTEILPEVSSVIIDTIKEFEKKGGMYISGVHFGDFIDAKSGKRALFQIFPNAYGMTEMNINSTLLKGQTLMQIDERIAKTSINKPRNLKEAVIHECGHAKVCYGKTPQQIEEINNALEHIHIEGISTIATEDGAECIAEVEVMLYRGEEVPKEAMELYEKYVR